MDQTAQAGHQHTRHDDGNNGCGDGYDHDRGKHCGLDQLQVMGATLNMSIPMQ